MSPLEKLRGLLSRWRGAQCAETRARWAGEPADARGLRVARAALGTGEARALYDECVSLRLLDDRDRVVLLGHSADAAREELAVRRGAPKALELADEVELGGEPITLAAIFADAARWPERAQLAALGARGSEREAQARDLHAEADALAARVLERGPAQPDDPLDLTGWLEATDEVVHEALARTQHALGLAAPRAGVDERVALTVRALRASPLEVLFREEGRLARLGRALAPLGADAVLARRLHIESRSEATLDARVLLLEPPRRVVLGLSRVELGLASELSVLEALGQGLAHTRVSPALGVEHRVWPSSEVPRVLGALSALLATVPTFLTRSLGLEGRGAHASASTASYLTLAKARLEVARAHARASGLRLDEEDAHALASRCLALPTTLPIGFVLASGADTAALALSARSWGWAPALYLALRERHDEDFFRNPRSADTIGGAAARGARLSRRAWLAELAPPLRATDDVANAVGASGERVPDPAALARAFFAERVG